MRAKTQHETHPGAETLSAFAEQALSKRERGEVLEHLAICGRCRQIVALAQEAAGAEVAAAQLEVVRPRARWRRWVPALAPAAAVVATVVIAAYVHERIVEKDAEVAKLDREHASQKPPISAEALPPAPVAAPALRHGGSEKKNKTDRRESAEPRASVAEPEETATAPPADGIISGMFSAQGGPTGNARFELRRSDNEALVPSGAPDNKTPSDTALVNEERKKRAEEQKEDRQLYAAIASEPPAEPAPVSGSGGSSPESNAEPADVSAQEPETQPAPASGSVQFHGLRSMMGVPTRPLVVQLPSGRPAISIAQGVHISLAVDRRGEVFLSKDSGATWEKVGPQWTGRAVEVRKKSERAGASGRAPASEALGQISGLGTARETDAVFELVNDQGQVWTSVDGKTWIGR